MYKLVQGNSIKYFKENNIDDISLVVTSPSYFTEEDKQDIIEGEIGYGNPKEVYVKLIVDVLTSVGRTLRENGKIVLVLGRYNDLSIKSIIYMIEDKLLDHGFRLSGYTLHGKGDHESIVVFNKGNKVDVEIPTFYKLQIYDKVGFFGRISPDILDWAITSFTKENELVVDPFAGAGSTVKRADKLGRNGFGVELNKKFIS